MSHPGRRSGYRKASGSKFSDGYSRKRNRYNPNDPSYSSVHGPMYLRTKR